MCLKSRVFGKFVQVAENTVFRESLYGYDQLMSQETRKEAIARRVRENQGRRNRPAFLDGLSQAVGSTIRPDQLLNLDVTDQVRAGLSTGYASALSGQATATRVFFSRDQSLTALRIPELLAQSLADERVLLWLKQSAECGAVILTAAQVLGECEMILALDGDSVSMLSEDRTQGFIFDQNDGDANEAFELSVWGSRWLAVATACGVGPRKQNYIA